MTDIKLIDPYYRQLNYLRVSITDRCNLRCIYCVPTGRIPKVDHKEILRYEEMLRIIRIAVDLGITKVRVTGGEPLIRKGVYGFLEQINNIKGLKDVSLTTNAILLERNLEKIKKAGVKRINISLDSLKSDKFRYITGYNHFDLVWKNIEKARQMGFDPIKINVVALRGINDDEIEDFGKLSIEYPFHIRFIEYMPIGTDQTDNKKHLLAPEIKNRLEQLGKLYTLENSHNDGPARRYSYKDAKGEIGLITAMSGHFCNNCNRLRLTATGQLRTCLLSDSQDDLKKLIRGDATDQQIADVFMETIKKKKSGHHLNKVNDVKSPMSGIGG